MKYFLIAIAIVFSGCSLGDPKTEDYKANGKKQIGSAIKVWTDPETGCEYLMRNKVSFVHNVGHGGITPKLNINGKPSGCGNPS